MKYDVVLDMPDHKLLFEFAKMEWPKHRKICQLRGNDFEVTIMEIPDQRMIFYRLLMDYNSLMPLAIKYHISIAVECQNTFSVNCRADRQPVWHSNVKPEKITRAIIECLYLTLKGEE